MWLLALVILLPTACVLWFMAQAMQNERLAVEQKLFDFYQGQLATMRGQFDDYWSQQSDQLTELAESLPASEIFAESVEIGLADALIVLDDQAGVVYPTPSRVVPLSNDTEAAAWQEAARLELPTGDLQAAAEVYAGIASRSENPNEAGRALQAQARCLARLGQTQDAVTLLTQTLGQDKYSFAVDVQGRWIVADAELRALHLIENAAHDEYRVVFERLAARLLDYKTIQMPSSQRRFLWSQLRQLDPEWGAGPFAGAEDLAARWVDLDTEAPAGTSIQLSGLPEVWQLRAGDGQLLALYQAHSVRERLRGLPAVKFLSADVRVEVLSPGQEPDGDAPVVSAAGERMPGWRLSLSHDDRSLFDASTQRRITAYLWTGVLAIAATLVMALLIAWVVRRQIRVAKLKNDLVATVSHELKTPLASMRLLIDTLLDTDQLDSRRVREYLHLIDRENTRLSRLIENFLTFSRLEQNRYAFKPTEIAPLDIVDAAAAAVRDRFHSPGCRFEIEAAADLPQLMGDHDALVTAVVNLLDNAHKYSGEDKHIVLRAFAEQGFVCLQVQDNGIGISRVGGRRVFKRFYQVDQSLSSVAGGVGLGLSIVSAIAAAHGGTVGLESEPDRGSTFTLRVPTAAKQVSPNREAPSHAT